MKSKIYQGSVYHQRFRPRTHQFEYDITMVHLDLAELPDLLDEFWFCSARRFAPAWFRRSDHVFTEDGSLLELVRSRFPEVDRNDIRSVKLLTNLRYYGICFNPVSFYFCYDSGDELTNLGAEVHNTPWLEEHFYPLSIENSTNSSGRITIDFEKQFHVSPFLPMDLDYQLTLTPPDEELFLGINVSRDSKPMLYAEMKMIEKEFTQENINQLLTQFPVQTVKIIAGIYYQALKLWLKNVPFYEHPGTKDVSTRAQ